MDARAPRKRLNSFPISSATFIRPMECLAVSRLPDGAQWLYEILCGGPHKISSVAFGVMWRWDAVLARNAPGLSPARHIMPASFPAQWRNGNNMG